MRQRDDIFRNEAKPIVQRLAIIAAASFAGARGLARRGVGAEPEKSRAFADSERPNSLARRSERRGRRGWAMELWEAGNEDRVCKSFHGWEIQRPFWVLGFVYIIFFLISISQAQSENFTELVVRASGGFEWGCDSDLREREGFFFSFPSFFFFRIILLSY